MGNLGVPFNEMDLNQDSSWTASVRLSRSVALDTQKDCLATALMSYEPYLNPQSSLHQRCFSMQEASYFSDQRRNNPALKLVYNSKNISLL